MCEDLFNDVFSLKTADDFIAAEEKHCVFNIVCRKNDRIRKHKFDYEEYITSEIMKYFDESLNVDNRISEIIDQIRIAAGKQHAEFLKELDTYKSIMNGSCTDNDAFEYAYDKLYWLLGWLDVSDEADFSSDFVYYDFTTDIKYIDRSEFREVYFNTNKYKKLLTIPCESAEDYHDYINRLERQIREYMYDRKRFNIYNNLNPAIIELFRRECMHPGTIVFVNGRYKKIHGGWELREILRKRLTINIRTSEEFKSTANKHKHHNRFDTDIDLIKEEA